MQNNSHSDEDDQRFSKLRHPATGNKSAGRFGVVLGLCSILVIIGVGFLALSTSNPLTNLDCSALTIDSTCQPPSHPTVVPSPTVTLSSRRAPTAVPTFGPTRTPTQRVSGASSQAPTPAPTPIAKLNDQQVVMNTVQHYVELVVVVGAYRKAYNVLGPDFQDREPYTDFIQNQNYTLKKGCWVIGTMHVSQRDSLTWDVGVELRQVSCVDTTPIAYYDWHFEVQQENGLFVITSIGLYPTGSQNQ